MGSQQLFVSTQLEALTLYLLRKQKDVELVYKDC